jgi:hypothetical protein
MAHRLKIIEEYLDLNIAAANSTMKDRLEVDKHAFKIIGYEITSNQDALIYHRGSFRLTINEKEIKPSGYETKKVLQGTNVPARERMVPFPDNEELDPGNRKVEFEYTDTDHPATTFTPYRVRIYIYSRVDD